MRGTEYCKRYEYELYGFTLAYAGKRRIYARGPSSFQVHPRVCGEKYTHYVRINVPLGSPPRMRGKENNMQTATWADRFTPAYAGKRRQPALIPFLSKVHPRVCGEKKKLNRLEVEKMGSPPRMRGKDD